MQLPPSQSLDNLLAGLSTDRWAADDLSTQHDMDLDRLPHPPPVLVKAEVGGAWVRMGLLVHFEGNAREGGSAGGPARLIGGLGPGAPWWRYEEGVAVCDGRTAQTRIPPIPCTDP